MPVCTVHVVVLHDNTCVCAVLCCAVLCVQVERGIINLAEAKIQYNESDQRADPVGGYRCSWVGGWVGGWVD